MIHHFKTQRLNQQPFIISPNSGAWLSYFSVDFAWDHSGGCPQLEGPRWPHSHVWESVLAIRESLHSLPKVSHSPVDLPELLYSLSISGFQEGKSGGCKVPQCLGSETPTACQGQCRQIHRGGEMVPNSYWEKHIIWQRGWTQHQLTNSALTNHPKSYGLKLISHSLFAFL